MVNILERHSTFTTLGIRFMDVATDTQVKDDLVVTARLLDTENTVVKAFQTASGIYAFQQLPGLRAVEYMQDPPPGTQTYVVEVSDAKERFVPVVFTVDLPFANPGLFPAAVLDPDTDDIPPGFYLFTSPLRTVVPGFAVVRVQLELPDGTPASYAVIEIENQGTTWTGLADEAGNVAVQFPYPPFTTTLQGSPPSGGTPLSDQLWDLSVRVRHEPAALTFTPGSSTPLFPSVLAQSQRAYFEEASSPTTLEAVFTLQFGQPAILRTRDGPEDVLSVLLVEPAP